MRHKTCSKPDDDYALRVPRPTLSELLCEVECSDSAAFYEQTALHLAAARGHDHLIGPIVRRFPRLLDARDIHGLTPLHAAVCWGRAKCAARLLQLGANLAAETNDGLTPLHCAAAEGHRYCLSILLKAGAPLTPRDNDGRVPLDWAIGEGRATCQNLLCPSVNCRINDLTPASDHAGLPLTFWQPLFDFGSAGSMMLA